MKRGLLSLLVIGLVASGPAVRAATPEQIEASIVSGLAWFAGQQRADGRWSYEPSSPYEPLDMAATGLVALKLVDRAKELGLDPFQDVPGAPGYYVYAPNVKRAFGFLFGRIQAYPGRPELAYVSGYETYATAIAAMAIASTNAPERVVETGPLTGSTYRAVAEGLTRWLVEAQNATTGCGQGGWGYAFAYNAIDWADQSNAGYASLALGVAAAPGPEGFGIAIPPAVLTRLDSYVTASQVVGGPTDGASIYNPCWGQSPGWENILKTGNLLYELALVGDQADSPRVLAALGYIERTWTTVSPGGLSVGWMDTYQGMFTMMKGLDALGVERLSVPADVDWFDVVSTYLVGKQLPDGSFAAIPGMGEGEESPTLRTAWALLTLERIVPRIGIPDQCVPYGTPFTPFDADAHVIVAGLPPYTWSWTGEGALSVSSDPDNVITVGYPVDFTGSTTITFTMTDAASHQVTDPATFRVDPVPAVAIPDQTAPFQPVDLDAAVSGIDPALVTWTVSGNVCLLASIDAANVLTVVNPGCATPETLVVTATALACGAPVSAEAHVVFTPNRPPVCAAAAPSQACLWPPNNKMQAITILGVADPDGDPVTLAVTGITTDEATATELGAAGKNFAPDAAGLGTGTPFLRAERSGLRDGRVYVIHFGASDGRGGACTGAVTVVVPHDEAAACTAVDSGQLFDATVAN